MNEFQATAWYDAEANRPLVVAVATRFANDHIKKVEATIHSYTVKVPYTVMLPFPITTYEQVCNSYGCITVPHTKYITIPMTEYREEPRQFPYSRWRHHQILVFHAEMLSDVLGIEARATHIDKAENTDTEHPHSVPEAGLFPDPLTLPDPLRWLKSQIDEATHKWGRALSQAWVRLYCTSPESAITGPARIDYVFRCLREPQDPIPAFAEAWHREYFGASRAQVEQWLNRTSQSPQPVTAIKSGSTHKSNVP